MSTYDPAPESSDSEWRGDAIRDADDIAERQADADTREAALNFREARIEMREAATVGRQDATNRILAEASVRDDHADERDAVADTRERVASLEAFLQHSDEFDATHIARRAAAMDRVHAKTDRKSSADDRSKLTDKDGATVPNGDR